jgi:hypothetical protein
MKLNNITNLKSIDTEQLRGEKRKLENVSSLLNELTQATDGMDLAIDIPDSFPEIVKTQLAAVQNELDARHALGRQYSYVHLELGMEITREIGRLKSEMQHADRKIRDKREQLRKAGISKAEVLRLAPEVDFSANEKRIEKLDAEQTAWQKFCKSKMARDLPSDANETAGRIRLKLGICPGGIREDIWMQLDMAA